MVRSFDVFQGIRVHGRICYSSSSSTERAEGTLASSVAFEISVVGERRVKMFSWQIETEQQINTCSTTTPSLPPSMFAPASSTSPLPASSIQSTNLPNNILPMQNNHLGMPQFGSVGPTSQPGQPNVGFLGSQSKGQGRNSVGQFCNLVQQVNQLMSSQVPGQIIHKMNGPMPRHGKTHQCFLISFLSPSLAVAKKRLWQNLIDSVEHLESLSGIVRREIPSPSYPLCWLQRCSQR